METKNKLKWWHIAIITFAVIIGLFSVFIRPTRWDEMHYVDPGAQLVLQGRMVSTVWVTNSPNELWASSNPGMPLLFACWFKVFGFGFIQSKILFFILHLSGVYVFFSWIRKKFNPSAGALVLGISGSFILPSLAESFYNLRLDVCSFSLFTFFLYYTWTKKENIFLNWFAPILFGFLLILWGFHFALFYSLASVVAFVLIRNKISLVRAIAFFVGICLGIIILWLTYLHFNMWDTLIAARSSHFGKILPWCPIGWHKLTVLSDWPIFLLLTSVGLLGNLKSDRSRWLPWILALLVFFLVPFIISSIGIYYRAYIWMVALPMVLCFYYAENLLKSWYRFFVAVILSCSLIVFSLYSINSLMQLYRDAQQIKTSINLIKEKIPPGSSIVADEKFYYQLIESGFKYYIHADSSAGACLGYKQDYFFPKNLRDQVKCIVFSLPKGETSTQILSDMGGEWILIGNFPAPVKGKLHQEISIYRKK